MTVITKCPTCDSDKIKKVRRKWTGKFDGQTYSVPRLEFHECLGCGEKVYDPTAMRRIEARSPAFTAIRLFSALTKRLRASMMSHRLTENAILADFEQTRKSRRRR